VIKLLNSVNLKKKKVVFSPTGRPEDKTFSGEYIKGKYTSPTYSLGDELHFHILQNRE